MGDRPSSHIQRTSQKLPDFVIPSFLIPFLICAARILDVTVGTLRIIFVSKGFRKIAPVLGFFEVLIWLAAIGQVMQNLTDIVNYIAYALGFSLGSYIGMTIERKLSLGMAVIRIITARDAKELISYLRKQGFGVTVTDAQGAKGKVQVIFTVIARTSLRAVVEAILKFNPHAFYTVEDIQSAAEGVFPGGAEKRLSRLIAMLGERKGK